ncbi:BatD family protein [Actibacterium lipolyticum]|uniref:Oxygen tolerance n=1 Tax=Actibacterium lipolyticum TaxID=1524263 RepID=A0A238KQL2_9RHOB|nr:BatD family protein [Actibacterium lipolyticum]SMX44911.1 hypothetical protein COL8621_02664 [Actibacterium lipolyticum]
MVKRAILILLLLWPACAFSQRAVDPADLVLTVTLEDTSTAPFQNEMVLLTIHGVYRRHITLEKLEQPDLDGFNWMQLGEDHWYESQLNGKTVKNMRRRMALFPDRAGKLKVGPFTHHLTLLDENDNWFEYQVQSDPLDLEVRPAPAVDDWWFPVRHLEITDRWSNAPDQLAEGEGVLRVIAVSALGVSPDMIPPMPELHSPSAHIFAHPEKRLVDLTPHGPVAIAYWRWTIKPRNPPSAILEPIEFSYFDTVARQMRTAKISAQRIAISEADMPPPRPEENVAEPAKLRAGALWAGLIGAFGIGLVGIVGTGHVFSADRVSHWLAIRRLKSALRKAARQSDMAGLRQAGHALHSMAGPDQARQGLLAELDTAIYSAESHGFDPKAFQRRFNATL